MPPNIEVAMASVNAAVKVRLGACFGSVAGVVVDAVTAAETSCNKKTNNNLR